MKKKQRDQLIISLTSLIAVIGFIAIIVIYTSGNVERAFSRANAELGTIKKIEINGERSYSLIAYEKNTTNKNLSKTQNTTTMKIDLDASQYEYKITDGTDNTGTYTRIIGSDNLIYTFTPELGWSKIDKETATANQIPTFYFDTQKMYDKMVMRQFSDADKYTYIGEEDLDGNKVYSYDIELSDAEKKIREDLLTKAFFEEYIGSSTDTKITFTELKYNIKVNKDTYKIAQQNLSYTIEFKSSFGTLLLNNGKDIQTIISINQEVDVYVPQASTE